MLLLAQVKSEDLAPIDAKGEIVGLQIRLVLRHWARLLVHLFCAPILGLSNRELARFTI